MGKYDDIINLPHHVSDYHTPMPMENRAAQFAPFAALTGHKDAISETARVTQDFRELSDDEKNLLSKKLSYAIDNGLSIMITYFSPDLKKMGGCYKKVSGIIKKWDEVEYKIILCDNHDIPANYISNIEFIDSNEFLDMD